jgi:hypothetical protein
MVLQNPEMGEELISPRNLPVLFWLFCENWWVSEGFEIPRTGKYLILIFFPLSKPGTYGFLILKYLKNWVSKGFEIPRTGWIFFCSDFVSQ